MKYRALTIAGFDSSGGAGIQADLKAFSALGCYGMSVLTALPVQNTTGVKSCYDIPLQCIEEQLTAIFADIMPQAIKTGMLFDSAIIALVSKSLSDHAPAIPLVIDPVMVAKSGHTLLKPEAIAALKTELLPLAALVTPNIPEAELLLGMKITNRAEMELAAHTILALGPKAVLMKGGHLAGEVSADFLLSATQAVWFEEDRIDTRNNHGTGCTLSAAITAAVAQGIALAEACSLGKRYLSRALLAAKDQQIGHGHGPVHHFYHLWPSLERI
jgi:hydroxymethylpyrimidine/phosphomethylpyrimidine kinase